MTEISTDWESIKSYIDEPSIIYQYIDINNKYYIVALYGPFRLECIIDKTDPKSSEQLEFEENYKDS